MRIKPLKPQHLLLLAAISLSPALCLANSHDCARAKHTQVLKQKAIDPQSLEAGLRTGRLTSHSPWRSISKKDPEIMDLTQRISKVKSRLTMNRPSHQSFAHPVYPPKALVLRI